jgi:non-specific serine/threonine protein kinase
VGDAERELRLAGALWSFWSARGHLGEGRRRLEGALERAPGAPLHLRANAAAAAGALANRQGDSEHAGGRFEQAFEAFQTLGDDVGTARMLGELGNLAVARGEYQAALERYEQARSLFGRLGVTSRVAKVTANMGAVANIQRDFERGRALLREALALQRAEGDRDGAAISLHNLGRAELQLGRLDEAARLLAEALREALDLGYREIIAYCLEGLGELALARDDVGRAALLVGAGNALFGELGIALAADDAETYERALATLRVRLGGARLEAELAAGAALPLDDAVALAVDAAGGRPPPARR